MRIYFRCKVSGSKQWTKATIRGIYNAHSKIVEWNEKLDLLCVIWIEWDLFWSIYTVVPKKKMWNRTIINLMMRILRGYYGRPTWIRYVKTKRNMIILITQQWHQWSEHRWKQSKRLSKSKSHGCLFMVQKRVNSGPKKTKATLPFV